VIHSATDPANRSKYVSQPDGGENAFHTWDEHKAYAPRVKTRYHA
jgi:hypothetical protein